MVEKNSESRLVESKPTPVIPPPIALYESNGLLFELYDGGQPYRSFLIRWETLKPIRMSDERQANSQQ